MAADYPYQYTSHTLDSSPPLHDESDSYFINTNNHGFQTTTTSASYPYEGPRIKPSYGSSRLEEILDMFTSTQFALCITVMVIAAIQLKGKFNDLSYTKDVARVT